jgi:hypothetical protein
MCVALNNTSHLFGIRDTAKSHFIVVIGNVIITIIIIVIGTSQQLESGCNNCAASMDCHTLLLRSNRMAFPSSKDY